VKPGTTSEKDKRIDELALSSTTAVLEFPCRPHPVHHRYPQSHFGSSADSTIFAEQGSHSVSVWHMD